MSKTSASAVLRGVKNIIVSFDMLHAKSQCAREVLRLLSSKKFKRPDLVVSSNIVKNVHPNIKVVFADGQSLEIDAVEHRARDVFEMIKNQTQRTENWKDTVMFRASLEANGFL
uniref:Ribosomal protein/NADH dehydrogenase domain-containing protein n=1 Tax=Spongospora subterranea TaxID=70186 RepID=A0A0H5QH07_9EUKA|eukprot:CRZ00907.1 hypothetical protein [Spongospora subterranea]